MCIVRVWMNACVFVFVSGFRLQILHWNFCSASACKTATHSVVAVVGVEAGNDIVASTVVVLVAIKVVGPAGNTCAAQ